MLYASLINTDTLMTPVQLKRAIATIGISQEALGRMLGHPSGRTVRRWLAGERNTPTPVEKLLTAMVKFDIKPEDLE